MKNTLMNTEMAKATIDDRKVQTRRVIKSHIDINNDCNFSHKCSDGSFRFDSLNKNYFATIDAKYQKGEIIWVREPVKITRCDNILRQYDYKYLADNANKYQVDIPERFIYHPLKADIECRSFPKWIQYSQGIPNGCIKEMARIFLKVTNVRVEKLESISYEDIVAEGFDVTLFDGTKGQLKKEAKKWWINLWNKTAPKGYKYGDDVYVFVYEFERVEK